MVGGCIVWCVRGAGIGDFAKSAVGVCVVSLAVSYTYVGLWCGVCLV